MLRTALVAFALLLASCQSPGDAPSSADVGARIVETMDSGGYTYVKLARAGGEHWYAVPQCVVAVGDRVEVTGGEMAMRNFESKTLHRTFPVIYFASGLEVVSGT